MTASLLPYHLTILQLLTAALLATVLTMLILKWPGERRDDEWPTLSEAQWNRQYDEAMRWRDWQTCDYLILERERADWYQPDDEWEPLTERDRNPGSAANTRTGLRVSAGEFDSPVAPRSVSASPFDGEAA